MVGIIFTLCTASMVCVVTEEWCVLLLVNQNVGNNCL